MFKYIPKFARTVLLKEKNQFIIYIKVEKLFHDKELHLYWHQQHPCWKLNIALTSCLNTILCDVVFKVQYLQWNTHCAMFGIFLTRINQFFFSHDNFWKHCFKPVQLKKDRGLWYNLCKFMFVFIYRNLWFKLWVLMVSQIYDFDIRSQLANVKNYMYSIRSLSGRVKLDFEMISKKRDIYWIFF